MPLLVRWLVVGIAAAAALAIAYVIIQAMGIVIPRFMIMVLWIVLAAVVGIGAIKLIAGMFSEPPPR